MRKKYIIFDFDGTLIRTNDIIVESWQETLKHFLGHGTDERTIENSFGETIRYTAAYMIPEADPVEVHEYFRDYQSEHCDGKVSLFPGITELLTELKARGYKLAIATSRAQGSFWQYIDMFNLRDMFDVAVTMEDVQGHKPDPEPLLVTLGKMGADAEEAIMLGDTRFDIGCANNAGVDSVLVKWSHYIDMEQMQELGFSPDYCIDEPMELLDII